ncbi:MAG: ATP-binding protein, partial [Bacillota bacterium]
MDKVNDLMKLTVFRKILSDEIIEKYINLINAFQNKLKKSKIEKIYYDMIFSLNHVNKPIPLQNNILKSYVFRKIIEDKNVFTEGCEEKNLKKDSLFYKQGIKDLKNIKSVMDFNLENIKEYIGDNTNYLSKEKISLSSKLIKAENDFIESNDLKDSLNSFISYIKSNGYGKIGYFKAFKWKNSNLHGVKNFDYIDMNDLYEYEYQKNTLIDNTKTFVKGKPANNVLLAGARGTGKSSFVKALISHFNDSELKLVEIFKDQLEELSDILNILKDRNKNFIIFIDDLSFEENETNYKHLKSIIEGGVEKNPDNVILYATSNRRHLIRETWDDRNDTNDIHGNDTVNEKLSLSDRFGITISFNAPNQEEYLSIVKGIGKDYGIDPENKEFIKAAKQWALSQNGRSGRTARQFVENYI